tara:strand:+ start:63 stop:2039 length:1977 start_codon:yes stop_codon:yes gene_type:complete
MADPLYHVTFSKNLPEIQKRGLDPLSGSLWQNAETEKRYQDQPSVFSFQDPEEALLWASKMGWEFRDEISDPSDISIVKLRGGDHWEPDPAAGGPDIGKTSMRSLGPVPFSDILEVISLPKPAGGNEEFQARHPRGNLQQWLKFYGNRLRGQEPRTTAPDLLNLYHATPVKGPVDFSIGELGAHFSENPDLSRRAMTLLGHEDYRILETKVDLGNVVTVPEQESFFNAEDLVTSLVNQGSISPEQASEAYASIDQVLEDPAHPAMERAQQVLDKAHIYGLAALEKQAETELLRPFLKKWGIDTLRYWNTYDAYGELGRLRKLPGIKEELELGTQPAWSYIVVDPELVRSVTEYKPGLPAPRPPDQPNQPNLPALLGPPEEPGKEPSKGRIVRGIGSLMRSRVIPLIQLAQMGYDLLPEDKKFAGDFIDYLKETKTHELFGMDKSGLDYFRDLFGMEQPEPPQETGPLPVVPAKENLRTVVESNTIGGRVSGDETVSIDSLFGDISPSKRAQDTVTDIMSQMSGPEGYVERLIVDQDGNVIEGAHRLEALRRLGISEVPITRIVDPTANLDLSSMRKAIEGAGKIHSDHVNQIMSQVGDMLESTGNDPEKVFEEFTFPEGYEKYFGAALDSVADKPLPKAAGGFVDKPLYDDARVGGLI